MKLVASLFFAFLAAVSGNGQAAEDQSAANALLIRNHHETLNRGDWKAAALDYSEDTRNFGRPVGRAVVSRILEDIHRTFPDFRLDIVELLAQGNLVVVRCKQSGTHRGMGQLPVNGGLLVGIAPTQKHFEIEATHWYVVRNGKIFDHRGVRDDLAMMQQLSLLPQPAAFDWAKFAAEASKP